MAPHINHYKADLRDMYFVLFEQFGVHEYMGKGMYANWDEATTREILQETYRFVQEVLGVLNGSGDRQGCQLRAGRVITPQGFREAWKQLLEAGIKDILVPKEFLGQGGPSALNVLLEELTSGANTSFDMYAGLARSAAEVIATFGNAAQKQLYAQRMFSGEWGGTMCLTEPHAGSDVGSATTQAVMQDDGKYLITGTKIFISCGDNDFNDNIIHLVLARVPGAPAGTKGLSLFIVPRIRVAADGKLLQLNDVHVGALESKMGINASATCAMVFGEHGACVGELIGPSENQGMSQMFRMMNVARIAVGIQGLAVTSSAYLNALSYAKERKQGAHYRQWKDSNAQRVPIIEHPGVRRTLLELKAHVEGIRALIVKLGVHRDYALMLTGQDDEKASYHAGQVDLLTPLVKAYASEEAWRLCGQAIQIYGGAGFLKDWPVEQYARDSKIFSIYEGTTHIQAIDLLFRKLGQDNGTHAQALMGDILQFVEANKNHSVFSQEVTMLDETTQTIMQVAMQLLQLSLEALLLVADRVLLMLSQLVVAWLSLDAAVKAEAALVKLPEGHVDCAFYQGKRHAAHWYARNILPQTRTLAKVVLSEDFSPIEIPVVAFAAP